MMKEGATRGIDLIERWGSSGGRPYRQALKRCSGAGRLWMLLRARQQELRIRREQALYEAQARRLGLPNELDAPALRQRLAQRLASRGVTAKRKGDLHIVYATPLADWERHNIPPALERFGTLSPFYLKEQGFDGRAENWLQVRHRLDEALLRFVAELHARQPVDVLVSYLSGWHIAPDTIRSINQMGIVTCAFWWDDRLYFRGQLRGGRYLGAASLAAAYDLNLTNASDSVVKYLVEGGLAMFWPEAANPDHFRPLERAFEFDVTFVGACYGQRLAFVDYLRRHGIRVEAFGPGWPNGPLPGDEIVDVYARSRINLGFSGVGYSMREMCLKGRDFEVPMSGALYLTSEQPDLHRVYDVGRQVLTFRDREACLAQINRLLADHEAGYRLRQAAREHCLREHTWERRFHDLFRLEGVLHE